MISEEIEQFILRYFAIDDGEGRRFQTLAEVEQGLNSQPRWREIFVEVKGLPPEKAEIKDILDHMVVDALLQIDWANPGHDTYRITDHGLYESAIGFDALIPVDQANVLTTESGEPILTESGDLLLVDDPTKEPIKVDSTDWTGLAKAVSPQSLQVIRDQAKALQVAIIQSDADIQTKTDACRRVEAVVILLEAPNVPWREVVGLLNHPSVTAFLVAVNLIQFIIGLAT